jgi:hypothetical protein
MRIKIGRERKINGRKMIITEISDHIRKSALSDIRLENKKYPVNVTTEKASKRGRKIWLNI